MVVDSVYYGKLVCTPLNIIRYNVLGRKGGPELDGESACCLWWRKRRLVFVPEVDRCFYSILCCNFLCKLLTLLEPQISACMAGKKVM